MFLLSGCIGKKVSDIITSHKKVIKVGVCESLTSQYKDMGMQGLYGVRFANENYDTIEIEGEKYKIELVEVDNKSTINGAQDAAKKLINEKVSFVIGGYSTDACLGMIDVLDKANVPTIICTNPNIAITNGRLCTYRLCKDDTFLASCMANHIKNKGDNTVAIICENDDKYCESIIKFFEIACEKLGIDVVKKVMIDNDLRDMTKYLYDIKDVSPESIYVLTSRDNAPSIVSAIRETNIESNIYGSDIWEYKSVIGEAGNNCEGIDFISFFDYKNVYTDASHEFLYGKGEKKGFINYLIANGQEEYIYPEAALSYDAYMIIYNAILNANSTKIEEVLKYVDDITYEGVNGVLSFDENGDVRQNKAYIKRIKNGKIEYIETINLDTMG